MVITGALQTIRNVWPDVSQRSSTCCGSFWRLGNAPKFTGRSNDARILINTITECVPPNGQAMLRALLQAMLDGIAEDCLS